MTPQLLLASLDATLARMQAVLPRSKAASDRDEPRRLAIERLWITAGNVAEGYRRATGPAAGEQPWAQMYGYRSLLAHALPGEIDAERVWHETVTHLPRLRHLGR